MNRLTPRRRFADGGLGTTDPNLQGAINTYLAQGYPQEMAEAMAKASGPNPVAPYTQMTGAVGAPPAKPTPPPSTPAVAATDGAIEVPAAEAWKKDPGFIPAPAPAAATSGATEVPAAEAWKTPSAPAAGYSEPMTSSGTSSRRRSQNQGMFNNIQQPWLRALLAGGMGGMLGGAGAAGAGGNFGLGMLGSGTIAALLTLLQKKKQNPYDDTMQSARGGPIREEMMQLRSPRTKRMRFQTGGDVPPGMGMPMPPGMGMPQAMMGMPQGMPPGPPPAGPPPAPLPSGPPPGGPPPGAWGTLPQGGGPAAPPVAGAPGLGAFGGAGAGLGPAAPPMAAAPPLPQVAQPGAAIGSGLPAANLNALRAGLGSTRPQRRPYRKGGAVAEEESTPKKRKFAVEPEAKAEEPQAKAKGGTITRRPKAAPKVSIAVIHKKPVSTPSPYDYEGPDGGPIEEPGPAPMAKGGKWIGTAIKKPGALHADLGVPKGEKIPAKRFAKAAKKSGKVGERARMAQTLKKIRKRGGGECDKMAAGGAAKQRRGYPNTNPIPQRLAQGGKVRGTGAATKGCTFSGIY